MHLLLCAVSEVTSPALPVGSGPTGVVYDGANVWVTDFNGATVTKLKASSGATLGIFAVGKEAAGAAFDGANIWLADFGGTTVSKL